METTKSRVSVNNNQSRSGSFRKAVWGIAGLALVPIAPITLPGCSATKQDNTYNLAKVDLPAQLDPDSIYTGESRPSWRSSLVFGVLTDEKGKPKQLVGGGDSKSTADIVENVADKAIDVTIGLVVADMISGAIKDGISSSVSSSIPSQARASGRSVATAGLLRTQKSVRATPTSIPVERSAAIPEIKGVVSDNRVVASRLATQHISVPDPKINAPMAGSSTSMPLKHPIVAPEIRGVASNNLVASSPSTNHGIPGLNPTVRAAARKAVPRVVASGSQLGVAQKGVVHAAHKSNAADHNTMHPADYKSKEANLKVQQGEHAVQMAAAEANIAEAERRLSNAKALLTKADALLHSK